MVSLLVAWVLVSRISEPHLDTGQWEKSRHPLIYYRIYLIYISDVMQCFFLWIPDSFFLWRYRMEYRIYLIWIPSVFGSGKSLGNYWTNLQDKVPHKKIKKLHVCMHIHTITYTHTRTYTPACKQSRIHAHAYTQAHEYTHINTQTLENSAPCAMSIEKYRKDDKFRLIQRGMCVCVYLNTHPSQHICIHAQVSLRIHTHLYTHKCLLSWYICTPSYVQTHTHSKSWYACTHIQRRDKAIRDWRSDPWLSVWVCFIFGRLNDFFSRGRLRDYIGMWVCVWCMCTLSLSLPLCSVSLSLS